MFYRIAFQRGTVNRCSRTFGTKQISRADLHAHRAKRHGRRDAFCVGDSTGCNHGHVHRVDDLRQQCKGADLRCDIRRQKHATMAARLDTLRDDDVDAICFQPAGFIDCRCRRQNFCAPRANPRQ